MTNSLNKITLLAFSCLIYLKSGERIPSRIGLPVGYGMGRPIKRRPRSMCIASKRALLSIAMVAMSGFFFEASAADPVIAVKVAKAPDLAAGAADPAWAQAKAVTVP